MKNKLNLDLLEHREWRAKGGGTADVEVAVPREHHPAPCGTAKTQADQCRYAEEREMLLFVESTIEREKPFLLYIKNKKIN